MALQHYIMTKSDNRAVAKLVALSLCVYAQNSNCGQLLAS